MEMARSGKRFMIEVVGDPGESWLTVGSGPVYRWLASVEERRLKRLALCCSAASYVGEFLQEKYPTRAGVPQDVVSSIRLDEGQIGTPRQAYRGPILKVIQIGILTKRKRTEDLLAACSKLINAGVPTQVTIIGDGPEMGLLRRLADEFGIGMDVDFKGHIGCRTRLFREIDMADIFVMTSGSEGLPRVILEAMSRGLGVVASRIPGLVSIVRGEDMFPVGGVEELAGLLRDRWEDEAEFAKMSLHSVTKASEFTGSVLSPKRRVLFDALSSSSPD
jgi:glycosyltransferase involved in cell wall biosynthesis